MKIFKYVILLLILGVISLTVFIATSAGTYELSKSREIELNRATVFNYLSDYRNWNTWHPELENKTAITVDSIQKGPNAGLKWEGNYYKNTGFHPNDSLSQVAMIRNEKTQSTFHLKKTETGTHITWTVTGKMGFVEKVKAFFLGGAEKILGSQYEKGLNNINHYLIKELSDYNVQSIGIVNIPEMYYIKQNVRSRIDELGNKIFQSMESMQTFVKENNLVAKGAPFTVFEDININLGYVNYAVCLPITTEIHTSEGSDIISGKTESFYAFKTVLRGDYSHSDKAWDENRTAISKYKLTENKSIKPVAIYKKSILDTNKPSEWETEILTPVFEKYVVPFSDGIKSLNVVTNLEKAYASEGATLVNDFEKNITLSILDEAWKKHLRKMDELKQSVQLAVHEQKDPLLIYKFEAFNLFKATMEAINKEVISFLMKGDLPVATEENQQA